MADKPTDEELKEIDKLEQMHRDMIDRQLKEFPVKDPF